MVPVRTAGPNKGPDVPEKALLRYRNKSSLVWWGTPSDGLEAEVWCPDVFTGVVYLCVQVCVTHPVKQQRVSSLLFIHSAASPDTAELIQPPNKAMIYWELLHVAVSLKPQRMRMSALPLPGVRQIDFTLRSDRSDSQAHQLWLCSKQLASEALFRHSVWHMSPGDAAKTTPLCHVEMPEDLDAGLMPSDTHH